jgi:hypothetical protein
LSSRSRMRNFGPCPPLGKESRKQDEQAALVAAKAGALDAA